VGDFWGSPKGCKYPTDLTQRMPGPKASHTKHINGRAKRLRPGQPALCCKLDDRLEARFCNYVREGLPYEACAALVGISKQTFFSWRGRGEAESEANTRYARFAKNVELANAEAMRRLHNKVMSANPQWILERRFPNHYGPPKLKAEAELTGPEGGPLQAGNPYKVEITCSGPQVAFPILDESGRNGEDPPPGYRKETDRHGRIWFIPISADAMADASWISGPKL
jgi:hypothetical protein